MKCVQRDTSISSTKYFPFPEKRKENSVKIYKVFREPFKVGKKGGGIQRSKRHFYFMVAQHNARSFKKIGFKKDKPGGWGGQNLKFLYKDTFLSILKGLRSGIWVSQNRMFHWFNDLKSYCRQIYP